MSTNIVPQSIFFYKTKKDPNLAHSLPIFPINLSCEASAKQDENISKSREAKVLSKCVTLALSSRSAEAPYGAKRRSRPQRQAPVAQTGPKKKALKLPPTVPQKD